MADQNRDCHPRPQIQHFAVLANSIASLNVDNEIHLDCFWRLAAQRQVLGDRDDCVYMCSECRESTGSVSSVSTIYQEHGFQIAQSDLCLFIYSLYPIASQVSGLRSALSEFRRTDVSDDRNGVHANVPAIPGTLADEIVPRPLPDLGGAIFRGQLGSLTADRDDISGSYGRGSSIRTAAYVPHRPIAQYGEDLIELHQRTTLRARLRARAARWALPRSCSHKPPQQNVVYAWRATRPRRGQHPADRPRHPPRFPRKLAKPSCTNFQIARNPLLRDTPNSRFRLLCDEV